LNILATEVALDISHANSGWLKTLDVEWSMRNTEQRCVGEILSSEREGERERERETQRDREKYGSREKKS
jgi:hypothetical protein